MTRLRGWGLLLALCVVPLVFFGWSRLGSEKSRINLERFEQLTSGGWGAFLPGLDAHFVKNRRLAVAGEFAMPPVPGNSGIKSWSLRADATVLVELDAKLEGRAVQLRYVPVVRSATSVVYECLSTLASVQVARFCRAGVLRSDVDTPEQLVENARMIASLPAIVSASSVDLRAGTAIGSVVVVPEPSNGLEHCGYQCVKPQSCVTPRPLACSKLVDEGGSRRFVVLPSTTDFRGSGFATRSAADAACEQSAGTGFRVLLASSVGGSSKLVGATEYWVQNDVRAEGNCWETDYR